MGKKILVLTGSPRKNGNSDLLADALIRGVEEGGHTAVKFDAGVKQIGGCTACDKCWSNGHACIYEDDFHALEPLLESCDVMVFCAPVYWMGFPAQMKAAIDKLYAYGGSGGTRPLAIKESALLLCGEDPAAMQYDYVAQGYQRCISFLGWKDRGFIWKGGAGAEGTIDPAALKKAEELGKSL